MVEPAGRVFGARLWEAQVEHIWNNGLAKKKRKKHPARLYVPAVPILIPPLPSSALWWRRSAAITASDCCWAHARLHLTKPDLVCFCKTMSPKVVNSTSLHHFLSSLLFTGTSVTLADLQAKISHPFAAFLLAYLHLKAGFTVCCIHWRPYWALMTFAPHMACNVMEITSMCSK